MIPYLFWFNYLVKILKFLSIPYFNTTVNSDEDEDSELFLSEVVLEFEKELFVNYPNPDPELKFLFPIPALNSCKSIKSDYKLSAFYFAFVLISICYL